MVCREGQGSISGNTRVHPAEYSAEYYVVAECMVHHLRQRQCEAVVDVDEPKMVLVVKSTPLFAHEASGGDKKTRQKNKPSQAYSRTKGQLKARRSTHGTTPIKHKRRIVQPRHTHTALSRHNCACGRSTAMVQEYMLHSMCTAS